ncbi:MAG: hypothetical protein KAS32_07415 [Candidatus Peribacteraceae bacterium]|nr:hypothetical protein [Candidatus Peribacteraceae bacterium]
MKLSRKAWHYKLWKSYIITNYRNLESTEKKLTLCKYFWTIALLVSNVVIFKPWFWCFGVRENRKHSMSYNVENLPMILLKFGILINIWMWASVINVSSGWYVFGIMLSAVYCFITGIIAAITYIKLPSMKEKTIDKIGNGLDLIFAFASAKKNKVCPKLEVVDD